MVFFSWIHTIAHWNNSARLVARDGQGIKRFLTTNFATAPGLSGYVMLATLMVMAVTSTRTTRRDGFERFWSMHHLFIIFFLSWSVHGAFCKIKPGGAPSCERTGLFWQCWIYGGAVYLLERILREWRGRRKTFVTKVVQHPRNVVEIQMTKEKIKPRAGQVRNSSLSHGGWAP